MPERSDDYQLPSFPKTLIDRPLWNGTMANIAARLFSVEARAASFAALEAQGIQASLDYIQANVAPQIANLQTKITLAQEQIDQIIVGGKAPDTLKFGGQLPAYYATANDLTELRAGLSIYMLKDQRDAAEGVAPLGLDRKVPLSNLPTLTTTTTVGAAVAGANGVETPDDGDAFAGVKAGSSTMFKVTWANIKAKLAAFFDTRYVRLVGGVISGNIAIVPGGSNWAIIDLRAEQGHAAAIDFSPNGYSGDYLWRQVAQSDSNMDWAYNGQHRVRFNNGGQIWTSTYGWLNDRFADRAARVWHDGGIWEFGAIDPNYNDLTADAPNPYVLIGLRSSRGTNTVQLRAVQLRNN